MSVCPSADRQFRSAYEINFCLLQHFQIKSSSINASTLCEFHFPCPLLEYKRSVAQLRIINTESSPVTSLNDQLQQNTTATRVLPAVLKRSSYLSQQTDIISFKEHSLVCVSNGVELCSLWGANCHSDSVQAIVLVVIYWFLRAEARVQAHATAGKIYDGQIATVTGFSRSTSTFASQYHSTSALYSSCSYQKDKREKPGNLSEIVNHWTEKCFHVVLWPHLREFELLPRSRVYLEKLTVP
jgi:hypothetical protein